MQINESIENSIEVANHEDVKGSDAPVKSPVDRIGRQFNEQSPEWEYYLERLAEAAPLSTRSFINDLKTSIAIGGQIDEMTPDQYGLEARWRRLFVLCKNHIHSGSFSEAQDILETYTEEFSSVDDGFTSRVMYLHLKSEILKNMGGKDNLKESFRLAIEANSSVGNHPGIKNNIGEIITIACSEDIFVWNMHDLPLSKENTISIGVDFVESAIDNHPEIPTYHATLGRLLALEGDFVNARKQINEAIRLANPDYERYNIRISRYQRFLSQIELRHQEQELSELSSSMEKLKQSIRESKSNIGDLQDESENRYEKLESKYNSVLRDFQTRNLQFIGFFAVLIAVIIAIIDISISMPYREAAGLMLLLIGGMLLAFAGLLNGLPLAKSENNGMKSSVISNVIIGSVLILTGLLVPYLLP